MTTRTFDRETLLDLLVNFVPLAIILFFVGAFAVFDPWGYEPLATPLQFALLAAPFVLLAVLTYFSAIAIAGTEKTHAVFLPGQAAMEDAEPLEGEHEAVPEAETRSLESGDETAESDESDE